MKHVTHLVKIASNVRALKVQWSRTDFQELCEFQYHQEPCFIVFDNIIASVCEQKYAKKCYCLSSYLFIFYLTHSMRHSLD